MMWVLGHKQDFELWKTKYNCPNFDYNKIYKGFQKSEQFSSRKTNGNIAITSAPRNEVTENFIEACKNLDMKETDFNQE